MNSPLSLRIRSPSGQFKLDNISTLSELLLEILKNEKHEVTLISDNHLAAISIKKGFPPKAMDLKSFSGCESLKDIGIKNNDNLIVEIDMTALQQSSGAAAGSSFDQMKVPSDGSCLFNAISLGIEGTKDKPQEMRDLIATIIFSDTQKYNRQFLGGGMEPEQYAAWIAGPTKEWGGIPELKMLSKHYETKLKVVDVGEGIIYPFGEYQKCIYLIFDGTHYNLGCGPNGRTIFEGDETDPEMLNLALEIKESGQWIDPNLFALKCSDCGAPLQGQIEAVAHAQQTKHANFSQVEGAEIFQGSKV